MLVHDLERPAGVELRHRVIANDEVPFLREHPAQAELRVDALEVGVRGEPLHLQLEQEGVVFVILDDQDAGRRRQRHIGVIGPRTREVEGLPRTGRRAIGP